LQNFLLQFINILPDERWPRVGWCQNLRAVPRWRAGAAAGAVGWGSAELLAGRMHL